MDGIEKLELPWPVSLNAYYRIRQNRIMVTAEARNYRQKACFLAYRLRRAFWHDKIYLKIEAYPPNKRKFDIDNVLKCLIDSLQEAKIFENDSQIETILIEKKEIQDPAKVIISISKINVD